MTVLYMVAMLLLGIIVGVTATILISKFYANLNMLTLCYVVDGLCKDTHIDDALLNAIAVKYLAELYPELSDDKDLIQYATEYIEQIRNIAQNVRNAKQDDMNKHD